VSDESGPDASADASEDPAGDAVNPIRRTLDVLVFAPVGLALTALEDLPGLVTKGRERVETEISNARIIGKFVVDQGQRELGQRIGDLLSHGGSRPDSSETEAPGETAAAPKTAPVPATAAPAAAKPAPDQADTDIVERALAGYDTLSASQVVRRLESLGPVELRAVHRHEASHRNRRTILNRTSQLLDEESGTSATPTAPTE
jgi:pyruvate/2-oxoglutarate dehydrogenase complex dihydrolipoamide acyltransferase (E2) component